MLTSDEILDRVGRLGLKSVSAIDLLAIVLAKNPDQLLTRENTALQWIQNHALHKLNELSPLDLHELAGIEDYEATRLLAAIELGRRANQANKGPIETIGKPEDVVQVLKHLQNEKKEHFCSILLNSKGHILCTKTVHIGTINMSLVGPREVFYEAIREGAANLILAHNHPSGDPQPSADDILVNNKLVEVGNLLGIRVLDHVIIGHNRYFSFKEECLF
jgi:DNA repair protein RadC